MSKQRRPLEQPWKVPVAVTDVPETGKRIEFAADAATRAAVASLAGVAGVPRLEAQFDLTRQGREGLRAVGRVAATVEQNCVVTLEPLLTTVDEAIDLVFTPTPGASAEGSETEQIHALGEREAPQALDDGAADLGAVAVEFLLLGIDPYPRKAGVVFDAPPAGDPQARPFAVLAALKKNPGGTGS
jgi:uncharacterized metal-binding protein YceD (DUF177 family)